MENNYVIKVENISKSFRIYSDRGRGLKDRILTVGRNKYEEKQVIKGISFKIKKGEAIGLIGKNGCGKSTTLKLLTRIIYPDSGSIEIKGKVSSLLELGAGFHPDMTGRENIYLNASVFGLTRKQIDDKVDSIIKFSELEEFIDNPVRTYSSGMYMRLAFSVAINVEADILLIDEILAVGDVSFQKKCFEKLKEIKIKGATIVIVSHSLNQIEEICDRSIWIENGLVRLEGRPDEVDKMYLREMEKNRLERFQEDSYEKLACNVKKNENVTITESEYIKNIQREVVGSNDNNVETKYKRNLILNESDTLIRSGNQKVKITDIYITNEKNEETLIFEERGIINIHLKYEAINDKTEGTFCVLIHKDNGVYCFGTNTYITENKIIVIEKKGTLDIQLRDVHLIKGRYYISVGMHDLHAEDFDYLEKFTAIQIRSEMMQEGIVDIDTTWSFGK